MGKKIFISSTYLDLIKYRQGIWKLLNNYNVEILGMEAFGARKSNVLQTCLSEVEKSDIFLCVIGMKYGSIEVNTKKSYTQLEYEKALECNLDILVYMIDENNGYVLPKNVDIGEAGELLRKFKDKIKIDHTSGYFRNKADLLKDLNENLCQKLVPLRKLIKRPRELFCKTTNFKVEGENWIAFVSYLNNLPYEILTIPYDDGLDERLPNVGSLKYDTGVDKEILCFSFTDRFGFKNTMGGIDYGQEGITKLFDNIITKLLILDTPIEDVINVINVMDINNLNKPSEWKHGVIKALRKSC